MAKVKCNVCGNMKNHICTVKNIGVAINKPRICEEYLYDKDKLKVKYAVSTIKIGYEDQQKYKQNLKRELKVLKNSMGKDTAQINSNSNESKTPSLEDYKAYARTTDTKHPLTGDLSRFLTTANKE